MGLMTVTPPLVTTFTRTLLDDASAQAFSATAGLWWTPSGGKSAVAVTRNSVNGAGDATETAQATIAIPAGAMGANGLLRCTILFSQTNSANGKSWRARLGGIAGTQHYALSAASLAAGQVQFIIRNRNAANSQVSYSSAVAAAFGQTTNAITTGAIDTASAQDLVITNLWAGATAAESMTLEAYHIEVLYGA